MTDYTPADSKSLRVLFAPDWRSGVAYQSLLAEQLELLGIQVFYPPGDRAWFPLTKAIRTTRADLLHMHWPEAYFGNGRALWLKRRRFQFDLQQALRCVPMVFTAHNILPHRSSEDESVRVCYRRVLQHARASFLHSQNALTEVVREFGLEPQSVTFIPLGDLSPTFGRPVAKQTAREILELPSTPVVLMFGVVEPYKGIEEIVGAWDLEGMGASLIVCGKPNDTAYGESLRRLVQERPGVSCRLGWMSDLEVRLWLSACDGVVFNYRRILSSGAAPLARSFGCPVVLPRRLQSVDLGEPNPRVLRFSSPSEDLVLCIRRAVAIGCDFEAAAPWRQQTAWAGIAETTACTYRKILGIEVTSSSVGTG
jgi:beta-1,4-mannosyltransferase